MVKDITDRKLAEDELKRYSNELEQSNKLKDLFIDIMVHDLLNPAGVAKNMARIALKEEQDPNKREALQLILECNERIIEMIENASKLAKLGSVEGSKFEENDLGAILRNATKEMTHLADEKNMEIKIQADGEYQAQVNPLVYDVFSNLIGNAIKYSPENSYMVVGIEDEGPNWKIFVADNGSGISDEDKDAIFDRFKRFKKGPVRGTGLGLAIVKKVVEVHKGKVWVEDNPDGGNIFYVSLPKERQSSRIK